MNATAVRPRILVVEDDADTLELVAMSLDQAGYEVLRARSAEAALELLGGDLPALILTDVDLPGLSGLELTGLLKSDPVTRSIPVIAHTAHAARYGEALAHSAGCDGYLTKPVRLEALVGAVAGLLAG